MRMQIQYKIHNGQKGRIEINNGREEVNLYCYHIGTKSNRIESNYERETNTGIKNKM